MVESTLDKQTLDRLNIVQPYMSRAGLMLAKGDLVRAREAFIAGAMSIVAEEAPETLPMNEPLGNVDGADLRTINRLEDSSIETVGQFLAISKGEFCEIPGCGNIMYDRFRDAVYAHLARRAEQLAIMAGIRRV